jgi:hypothetical protein
MSAHGSARILQETHVPDEHPEHEIRRRGPADARLRVPPQDVKISTRSGTTPARRTPLPPTASSAKSSARRRAGTRCADLAQGLIAWCEQEVRNAASQAGTRWESGPRDHSTSCEEQDPRKLLVRKKGLEPSRYCYRQPLKLVRLPIPPLPQRGGALLRPYDFGQSDEYTAQNQRATTSGAPSADATSPAWRFGLYRAC